MKIRKIIASFLCASMLLGSFAGCKKGEASKKSKKDKEKKKIEKVVKVNNEAMREAADKLNADIIDVEEAKDFMSGDCVLLVVDNPSAEDVDYEDAQDEIDEFIDILNDYFNSDMELNLEDIKEFSWFQVNDGATNIAFTFYADLGNEEVAGQLFNGLMDSQDDLNDYLDIISAGSGVKSFKSLELDFKKFSDEEFYFDGKDIGYWKLCASDEELIDSFCSFLENSSEELDISKSDIDSLREKYKDEIRFGKVGFGIYFNGSSFVFTAIVSEDNDFISDYETFINTIGLEPITNMNLSDYCKDNILPLSTLLILNISTYLDRAKAAATYVDTYDN